MYIFSYVLKNRLLCTKYNTLKLKRLQYSENGLYKFDFNSPVRCSGFKLFIT